MTEPRIIETIRKLERGEIRDSRRERYLEARNAAEKLGDLLNGCSKSYVMAGIVEGLVRQHRYLQNETIVTLLEALGEFGALPEGQYTDARNEFAHKLCRLLRERFQDELFWRDK
jgi:hypothetical protein